MSDRYIVAGTTGYAEHCNAESRVATAWFVADSFYCYREMPLRVPRSDRGPDSTRATGFLTTFRRDIADFSATYYNTAETRADATCERCGLPLNPGPRAHKKRFCSYRCAQWTRRHS